MDRILIQYGGTLNSKAALTRALEGAKGEGNGCVITTCQGKTFLFGTPQEILDMISGFPENVQSQWITTANGEKTSPRMIDQMISEAKLGMDESFRPELPWLFESA